MSNYVSLIADIENSRGYSVLERNHIQKYMFRYIEALNQVFEKSLEFSVVFSAGDEIQGLFRDITDAVLYMRILEMLIRPVKMRVGIGIGEWNIKIEDGVSTQQDGPAYHRARTALDEVRKKQIQRYRIISDACDDELVNNLLNASYVLKEQQGDMQNTAYIMMELLYPFIKAGEILDYDVIVELFEGKHESRIGTGIEKISEPVIIDGKNFDSEKVIIKRGMSTHIAKIMGCSRQNTDKLIKRGYAIAIRNMDYVALQYIEREYGKIYV